MPLGHRLGRASGSRLLVFRSSSGAASPFFFLVLLESLLECFDEVGAVVGGGYLARLAAVL